MWNILSFLVIVYSINQVNSHALVKIREHKQNGDLKIEPIKAIIPAGANVTFTCLHTSKNATFQWDLPPRIRSYEEMVGASFFNTMLKPLYYSKITIFKASRFMSGEIACSIKDDDSRAVGFLVVHDSSRLRTIREVQDKGSSRGVRELGGFCITSSNCYADRAVCSNNKCRCPKGYTDIFPAIRDVCVKRIYNLNDPCEFHMQCAVMVDRNSICSSSVCVCQDFKDVNGRCYYKEPTTTIRPTKFARTVDFGDYCISSFQCNTAEAVCSGSVCTCPANSYYETEYNGVGICKKIVTGTSESSTLNGGPNKGIGYIFLIFIIIAISCCGICLRYCSKQTTVGQANATQINSADRWTAEVDRALQNRSTQIHNADHWTFQTDSALLNRRPQIIHSANPLTYQIDSAVQNRTIQIDSAVQNRTTQIDSADSPVVNLINDKPPSYDDVVTDPPNYKDALQAQHD